MKVKGELRTPTHHSGALRTVNRVGMLDINILSRTDLLITGSVVEVEFGLATRTAFLRFLSFPYLK